MEAKLNPKMMFTRAITGLPSTILLILMMERRMMPIDELVMYSASNDDYVRAAVKTLGPDGLGVVAVSVRERGQKWVGLAEGYQAYLPGIFALEGDVQAQIPDSGIAESGTRPALQDGQKSAKTAENEPKTTPDSGIAEGQTGSIMIDDDELINSEKQSLNQSFGEKVKNFPTLEKILGNLELLFGDDLSPSAIPADTKPELALAWIAKLWVDYTRPGAKLLNPIGTLVVRLKKRERRKLHLEVLPDDYLQAIGIEPPAREKPISPYGPEATERVVAETLAELADDAAATAAMAAAIADAVPAEIQRAWDLVLEDLRSELPKSSYGDWVADTTPVAWDGSRLTVGARNEYAVRWLGERVEAQMIESLERAGYGAEITFVVLDAWLEAVCGG